MQRQLAFKDIPYLRLNASTMCAKCQTIDEHLKKEKSSVTNKQKVDLGGKPLRRESEQYAQHKVQHSDCRAGTQWSNMNEQMENQSI